MSNNQTEVVTLHHNVIEQPDGEIQYCNPVSINKHNPYISQPINNDNSQDYREVEYNGEMKRVTEIMEAEGHCVPYFGGSKEDTQAAHEVNRQRLLTEGVVSKEAYDAAIEKMKGK